MDKLQFFLNRFSAFRIMSSVPTSNILLSESEIRALSYQDLLSYAIRHACKAHTPLKRPSEFEEFSQGNRKKRVFDMSRYGQRLIALRVMYAGWKFHGFASQSNIENTVENRLFEALLKTRLIESKDTCCYSRAGRTDVGVSALGQVVGIRLRSNLVHPSSGDREIDYLKVINSNLPQGMRVLSWAPVSEGGGNGSIVYEGDPIEIRNSRKIGIKVGQGDADSVRRPGEPFSARFDAIWRSYRYFFVRGKLNVHLMQKGAASFVGKHDFRNFCRIDDNIANFERVMYQVEIRRAKDNVPVGMGGEDGSENTMYYIFVKGQAFLWHQVRCMAAVLFDIGLRKEEPNVIKQMLDDAKSGTGTFSLGKPQYRMASPTPLLLYECAYPKSVVQFSYAVGERLGDESHRWQTQLERADGDLAELFAEEATRAAVLQAMLQSNDACKVVLVNRRSAIDKPQHLEQTFLEARNDRSFLLSLNKGRHVSYSNRARDPTVDQKLERAAEKGKARERKADRSRTISSAGQ